MESFTTLTAIAAPLRLINVDTDMIIPKQFLKTTKRTGLGVHAFDELRYHDDGSERAEFVLNQEPYNTANILIAGDNFGCGSSREHAPWALLDFGLKCIIAPSFADIFYNNSFKNGILPIFLPENEVETLMKGAEKDKAAKITVDLASQMIKNSQNETFSFEIDPFRKHCLLNGLDDIGLTLEQGDDITAYETKKQTETPWLYREA